MGQYYKPMSLEKKQWVYSHDIKETYKTEDGRTVTIGNGLKLMEHSWIGNRFVQAVESLITRGGAWYGTRIVWAGDYADNEKRRKNNLYSIIGIDKNKVHPKITKTKFRFVINLDTKEFVDKTKVPISDVYVDSKGKEWPYSIHPLPILTCEGNGRGGGDFHKEDPLVGKWARNRVTVSTRKPKGYTEIEFNLFEGKEPAKLKATQSVSV